MKHKSSLKLEKDKYVLWNPSCSWYFKTFAIVIGVLIVLFFILNIALKPYMRQINPELTPWIKSGN
ncbi:MAG: hypothetical protein LBD17_05925 [Endomicrobium sp.]|jgi:flagellar biosynthesis/type III secretory pathway M-ring protein FliF/YscJ|nr:hypothetical protein [Endomicrobium sp.]